MPLDLSQLEAFLAVAEERHFGRAAERLGLGQPVVSRRVRALEDALGAALLVRTSRRTELTAAGRAALDRARPLLDTADRLIEAVRVAASAGHGAATVAFVASTTPGYLAPLVAAAAEQLPDVVLEVRQLRSADIAAALRRGDVDLAVVRPVAREPGLVEEELARERVHAVVPAAHRLAGRDRVDVTELDGEVVVAVARAVWPAGYDAAARQLRQLGVVPAGVREASSIAAAYALVAAGVGIYRTAASARSPRDGVAWVELAGVRSRAVLLRRPEPPLGAVQAVLELAREVLPQAVR